MHQHPRQTGRDLPSPEAHLHELQRRQIELEMENESLRRALRSREVVEAHGQNVETEDQNFRITAIRDITGQKRTEEALRTAKAEAEAANNAKSRFLAAASHDLRQPLSALKLYAGSLKGHVNEIGRPLLANMTDCIGSLSELLGDLLDLSKLEAGVVTPNLRDFDLADVLAPLVAAHGPEAMLKGLRLRCIPGSRMIRSDPVLLRRILGNLISNSVRYTERGGVLVAVRRRGGKTWAEVWDTGIGIPADKTALIFHEFTQLGDGARTRGSGLGLAIVARTATLLGLEIRVCSRPGRGSLFAVELPPGEAPAASRSSAAHASVYRPLRVALVEDNSQVRDAVALSLTDSGHKVTAAASGAALLAQLDGERPDILVSDYRLPGGETGLEVISSVRAILPDLPALLLTGDTAPGLVRTMADRGVVVVHKPVDLETLLAYLEDMTARHGA